MKEQFDKKLIEKIKVSFEQFQEPLDPIELEKFKKQYLGRRNKGFFSFPGIWWGGIAASVIIGAFVIFQNDGNEDNFIDPSHDLISSSELSIPEKENISLDTGDTPSRDLNSASLESESKKNEEVDNEVQVRQSEIKENPKNVQIAIAENKPVENYSELKYNNEVNFDNKSEKKEMISETFITSQQVLPEKNLDVESEEQAIDYIKNWLGDEGKIDLNNTLVKVESKKEPVKLGVLVAPQTISNTTQSLNLGAGIMSEFSFSRRVKLDVGLAYARQQLEPTSNGVFNFLSGNKPSSNDALSMTEDARYAGFSGNYINASNELSFGQLEIPINLKFKVLENKSSDLYVVSGFSNMVYLNQQNVTTYNAVNMALGNFVGPQQIVQTFSQTQTPNSESGNIDSGQMLNLGIGFEQSLKNGTFISIEPFYKVTLGTQTFSNQQFSIGGVNLRMNFQIKNKKE